MLQCDRAAIRQRRRRENLIVKGSAEVNRDREGGQAVLNRKILNGEEEADPPFVSVAAVRKLMLGGRFFACFGQLDEGGGHSERVENLNFVACGHVRAEQRLRRRFQIFS